MKTSKKTLTQIKAEIEQANNRYQQVTDDIESFKTEYENLKIEVEKLRTNATNIVQKAQESKDSADTNAQAVAEYERNIKHIYDQLAKDGKEIEESKKNIIQTKDDVNKAKSSADNALKSINSSKLTAEEGASNIKKGVKKIMEAGLSETYIMTKKSYIASDRFFTVASILTSIAMIGTGIWLFNEFTKSITSIKSTSLMELIRAISVRGTLIVLIYIPFIWLLGFLSKKASETRRLQEEYNHKANISRFYQNVQEEIEKLPEKDKSNKIMKHDIRLKTIEKVLDAAALNPSDSVSLTRQERKGIRLIRKKKEAKFSTEPKTESKQQDEETEAQDE